MKITKKEGINRIRIEHNKTLFWIIIILVILLIILIYFIVKNKNADTGIKAECSVDEDCVAATCCHPESCVNVAKAPSCSDAFCTMMCSGPLDCGAGSCGCVEGKCQVVPSK